MSQPIIVEKTFDVPPEKLWQAITDDAQMKKWYFDLPGFRPEVGYSFSFEGGTEENTYIHHCRIIEVVPGKKLQHTWRYEGIEGDTLVTFELFPEGNQTRLRLTHSGHETFPQDNPDLARENFVAGWNDIIGRSLKEYLENSSSS